MTCVLGGGGGGGRYCGAAWLRGRRKDRRGEREERSAGRPVAGQPPSLHTTPPPQPRPTHCTMHSHPPTCTCGLARQWLPDLLPSKGAPSQLMVGPISFPLPLRLLSGKSCQRVWFYGPGVCVVCVCVVGVGWVGRWRGQCAHGVGGGGVREMGRRRGGRRSRLGKQAQETPRAAAGAAALERPPAAAGGEGGRRQRRRRRHVLPAPVRTAGAAGAAARARARTPVRSGG